MPACRQLPNIVLAGALAATLQTGAPAHGTDDPQPIFVDRAAALGVDFVHSNGMTGELWFAEHMGGGAALADFDGDGDLDLWLGQGGDLQRGGGEPAQGGSADGAMEDRLFRNDLDAGELGFTDVTLESGLAATGYGMGVAVGDIDNDGDPDLYLLNLGANELWRNDSAPGALRFTNITDGSNAADQRWSAAASFFDFDGDGLLDLFVGNYVEFRVAIHKQCASAAGVLDYCGPKAYPAEANRVLRNMGDGVFEDWTARLGLAELKRPTLGTVASDFNGDGLTDLYVANDQHANALLLNQAGAGFLDDASMAGAAVDVTGQPQASMGVLAEDFNGDGLVDLFMTHLRRETNTIYLNLGDGLWDDSTRSSGLGPPSFAHTGFGAAALDFDLDGELDIYVANGAVKRIEEQFRAGEDLPLRQPNQLFRGLGQGRFEEVGNAESPAIAEVSRGIAAGDLDNDGDRDLIVANNNGRARILIDRDRPAAATWTGIDLRLSKAAGSAGPGLAAGRRALGAWVGLRDPSTGATRHWRRFHTDGSFAAASDPRVVLRRTGESPLQVVVSWVDGQDEVFETDAPGRYVTVMRGRGEVLQADRNLTP